MYQTISQWDFVRAFTEMNRENNFSEEGRIALFEFLEEVNPDSELDVIAICSDFAEYVNVEDLKADYSHLVEDEEFEDDDEVIDFFRNETILLELSNGGVIIQQF